MIGVGFKILTPTPVPKSPRVLPYNHRGYERVYKFKEQYKNSSNFSLFVYVNCVQLYSWLQVVLIMLNG